MFPLFRHPGTELLYMLSIPGRTPDRPCVGLVRRRVGQAKGRSGEGGDHLVDEELERLLLFLAGEAGVAPGSSRPSDREHHRVLRLFIEKDGDSAERVMREHVRASRGALMAELDAVGVGPARAADG